MPVRLTPRSLSSSAFFFQLLRRYRKLVRVDWKVPMMVAILTFRLISSKVSADRTTTSLRLHNPIDRRMISPHGFVPKSKPSVSLRPLLCACFVAATLLKSPRSPDLLSYKLPHSFKKIPTSGISVYATELFARARCPLSSYQAPFLAPRILSSVRLESEIRALLRTPPTTTTSDRKS